MTKDRKIETIERFFAAYAAHDVATLASILADDIAWNIPGRHPLSGIKRGVAEVVAFFDELAKAGFKADPIFLGANDEYVVDVHRGWSTLLEGKVDTLWALVWRFGPDGKVRDVVNLSADQAQMDAYCWANFPLGAIPDRLAPRSVPAPAV